MSTFAGTSRSHHLQGLISELEVLLIYQKQGFQLYSHRQKYYGTEIDLVVGHSKKIVFIEVKHSNAKDFLFYRMSYKQKQRLKNVYLRYIHTTEKEVEFHYVIMGHEEPIIFDDFLSS